MYTDKRGESEDKQSCKDLKSHLVAWPSAHEREERHHKGDLYVTHNDRCARKKSPSIDESSERDCVVED